MVIFHGHEAIIDARELPGELVQFFFRVYPGVCGSFRIKYPARCLILDFVALSDSSRGGISRGEEEEHIPICNSEVEDNFAVVGLVAADGVALKR